MDSKGPVVPIGKISKGSFERSNETHLQHRLIADCLILELRAWPKLLWRVTIGCSTPFSWRGYHPSQVPNHSGL